MPHGGTITLSTRAAEFPSEASSGVSSKAEPGSARRAVALAVKDNGCGMDEETRARLFEPFFTTKNPGEGTGLGLAMVERIVSEAGGRIAVESEPGRGTSIEVFFPAVEYADERSSRAQFSTEASAAAARAKWCLKPAAKLFCWWMTMPRRANPCSAYCWMPVT